MVLTALNTRTYHERFYTTKPATHIRLNQKDYVSVRSFFNERFPGTLTVDGTQVAPLSVRNGSQLKSQAADSDAIVQAFKRGDSAVVEYVSSLYGRGQKVSFSLLGFTKSYSALAPVTAPSKPNRSEADPISIIGPLLAGNQFSVRPSDLALRKNPQGKGAFVYVTKTRYSSVERLFVWFVSGRIALKLNGATHNLSPSLAFPRDAPPDFWEKTGLSASNATKTGLELAFGR